MAGHQFDVEDSNTTKKSSRCNPCYVKIGLGLVGVIGAVILLVVFTTGSGNEDDVIVFPDVTDELRIDCVPEGGRRAGEITASLCEARGCLYNPSPADNVPDCFLPQGNDTESGYKLDSGPTLFSSSGLRYTLKAANSGIYGNAMKNVILDFEMLDDNLLRFKFEDADNPERYHVPIPLNLPTGGADNPRYQVDVYSEQPFHFRIRRASTQTVIFDTGVGGLQLSDKFLQIGTRLPSKNVYGLGENLHTSFRHQMDYKTWPMFARDQPPGFNADNLYGVHPFYECVEDEDGNTHGVFLFNSNAMDYSFTPAPMLVYRTIGGVLDFYIFMGPTPETVIQQYTQVIGRPYMPPYWSLGFQLTRYGYRNTSQMKAAVDRTLHYDIPIDVQHADIDYMYKQRDFTLDEENFGDLPEYFAEYAERGLRNIIILDPCLEVNDSYTPYTRGKELDVFIKWPSMESMPEGEYEGNGNTTDMLGYVWPEWKTVFPDFFLNETETMWTEEIVKFKTNMFDFDGIWIDMNEPANFGTNEDKPWNWPDDVPNPWSLKCPVDDYDDPPYPTWAAINFDRDDWTGRLSDKTLCMIGVQDHGKLRHYDVHSIYGHSQAPVTLRSMREALGAGKRGMIITRSSYASTGAYAGHWLGDNTATWGDMAASIIGMLEFNLFGIPYVGADICGYFGDTTPELCSRWMQLGAFYPFSRNHNHEDPIDQDPGSLGEDVALVARDALTTRYLLLPYLYTLFHHAHTEGSTVARPLFHEFPRDVVARSIDRQFLWGPNLLISPILEKDQTDLTYYIPSGRWYDYYGGQALGNGWRNISVEPQSPIPLAIRGGAIIPTQAPANNTKYSRLNGFGLIVALEPIPDIEGRYIAHGDFFWDDGEDIDTWENGIYYKASFTCENNILEMHVEFNNLDEMSSRYLDDVSIFGVDDVAFIYINDEAASTEFEYESETKVLKIEGLQLPMDNDMKIRWSSVRLAEGVEQERLDCCPAGCDNTTCIEKGCIWDELPNTSGIPFCILNSTSYGYTVLTSSLTGSRYEAQLQWKNESSMFGNDMEKIAVITEDYNNILQVKFYDPESSRYEVPIDLNLEHNAESSSRFLLDAVENPFSLKISRADGTMIWDTSIGGLTFSDQFLQLSAKVGCTALYGLGENEHANFKHDMNYRSWGMWSRDEPPNPEGNLYGVHPIYMCVEDGGKAHGVLLLNSNAMEINLLPLPAITYRTTGGVLDFYIILGDSPEEVIERYTEMMGFPVLPPYWALGFQLSRYGYDTRETLEQVFTRNAAAKIPYDVQHLDIDVMDERKDFTWDEDMFPGLPDFVTQMRTQGVRVVTILDPFLVSNETDYYGPYVKGLEQDVFVRWPEGMSPDYDINNSSILLGWCWPKGRVVYPDFFHPNTSQYWRDLITDFYTNDYHFDGIWLDMNEPANFGTNEDRPWNWPEDELPYWSLICPAENTLEDPPYKPNAVWGSRLSEKTICMPALHNSSSLRHYDVHSLYGWSQGQSTLAGLRDATGKRSLLVSRSTYPSSGRYTGHWLGDNASIWRHMHASIIGILEFNLFGIPYVGADICGYFNDCPAELCLRWHQVGAFYTFMRNHNGLGFKEQDPAAYGASFVESVRAVLETRYRLLPYLYTLFSEVNQRGGTVIRPLVNEFSTDTRTHSIDRQFMWGPALLISPVLAENTYEVFAYIPEGRWFDYYTGTEVRYTQQTYRVPAPLDVIPLHIRGGYILPTQEPAENTETSRNNTFGLIVAPGLTSAEGSLYWDDGESIDPFGTGQYLLCKFTHITGSVSMSIEHTPTNSIGDDLVVDNIRVFGVASMPSAVNQPANNDAVIEYNSQTKELRLKNLQLPITSEFTISWS